MPNDLGQHYLENVLAEFRVMKQLGDRALAQLDEQQFFVTLDPASNSVAILVKHIAGNMRSRWTEFLTSDGEKPGRQRDTEFMLDANTTRDEVLQWWEQGWGLLFAAIGALQPDDVLRTVVIRHEDHTVVQAINRQLTHCATHVGQLVFLAKHLKAAAWQTLSVPRGQSEQINQMMIERLKQQSKAKWREEN